MDKRDYNKEWDGIINRLDNIGNIMGWSIIIIGSCIILSSIGFIIYYIVTKQYHLLR
jgi:hypothetical protein